MSLIPNPKATSLLAQELCGPVYQNAPSLGSAVSSAIASATAVAASLKSLDPTKSTSYPLCAVSHSAPPVRPSPMQGRKHSWGN